MAFEPFNVFSHRIDPRGVIAVLRKVTDRLTVEGPEDDWRQIVALGPKKLLRKPVRLVVTHDSTYYDGPGWSNQVLGMANYFSRFPDVPQKAEIVRAIHTFRFILGFLEADFDISGRDERVAWVHALCRHLDGVIFTPSSLRDAAGRFLISADGGSDPAAVLPAIPPTADHVAAESEQAGEKEDEEPRPPSAERVAARALVLAAVANRGLIENEREKFDRPDEIRERMLQWIEEAGVAGEVEPQEWKALQRAAGSLERQDTINAIWRLEGLGVLLWALGRYELPSYDQLVIPDELFEAAHLGDAGAARESIAGARLRSLDELAIYQTHALMVHWRLRDFSLRPTAMDFVAFSKKSWLGEFDLGPFHIAKNDMALGDKPIAEAEPDVLDTCRSSASERHLAINWLSGYSNIFSETDTST